MANEPEPSNARKPPQMATNISSPVQPLRVYNAIYSAVQVYECMVRGIAVMRRRVDSYVNATQILKVAGIDKGRRTKILEKEILPGKHEIVQGGYGKYQGTWIPLERGREIANQFGVAPLLAPLFDYVPPAPNVPPRMPGGVSPSVPRPFYSPQGLPSPHFGSPGGIPYHSMTTPHLPPQSLPRGSPFLPQAFPPMLNPSATPKGVIARGQSLGTPTQLHTAYLYPGSPNPYSSPRPLIGSSVLKRPREETQTSAKKESSDATRPTPSMQLKNVTTDGTKPPPPKRARIDPPVAVAPAKAAPPHTPNDSASRASALTLSASAPVASKNPKHRSIIASISHNDDSEAVIQLLKSADRASKQGMDMTLDEQGHTAMHFAASLSRLALMDALIDGGADINRGNLSGETPLMRCVLSLGSFQAQSFPKIMERLAGSVHTVDSSSRSVLHHIALVAGVSQRVAAAQYYMESVLEHLVLQQQGDISLRSVVDLRDIHGDTALNLAARIGNQILVQNLLDVGADGSLRNNLGLGLVDFGLAEENLTQSSNMDTSPMAVAVASSSVSEGDTVISELARVVQSLTADFTMSLSTKQDQYRASQAHVQAATRELAQQRRRIRQLRSEASELENVQQRIRNLEAASNDGTAFLWTTAKSPLANGVESSKEKTDDSDTTILDDSKSASSRTISNEHAANLEDGGISISLPSDNTMETLVLLRKVKAWQSRIDTILAERTAELRERNALKESQCKRVVSICAGVPIDAVDDVLGQLTTAIESEGPPPELTRISSFMQKANGQIPVA